MCSWFFFATILDEHCSPYLGCPTEQIERVWFNPSNSKRNWQTLGLWNCNESIDDELWDCLGPIHIEMKEIMKDGIDIALSTGKEVTIGINMRDINQDKKMLDNLHLLNTSRRHGCAHCNQKWENYWETMGTNVTRADEEMPFLRTDHESAILQGESNFTANDASGGNDSRPQLAVVNRSLTIGLVHLIISIGHMFFKMFLLLEHGGPLQNISSENGKQLKTKFADKFNTHIGIQMTANVGHLCSTPKHFDKLLQEFVPVERRPKMKMVFERWHEIVTMVWRKDVSWEEADAFQDVLTGVEGFGTMVHAEFPSLHCSDYCHMLLDHMVDVLKLTGGTGPFSEQPSEAVHYDVHRYLHAYSYGVNNIHALSDVLLRLMYHNHPHVRDALDAREKQKKKQ